MTSPAECLTETNTLVEAAGALARGDIGSMPVVSNGGELVGIITDRDIVVRAVADGRAPADTTVGEIMSADRLTTVSPNASPEEVMDCLSSSAVRRVPVVEDGRVVGVISQADVARELSNKDTGDVVEAISRP